MTKTKRAAQRGRKKPTGDEKLWEKRKAHRLKSEAEYRYPFALLNVVELFQR
jgi:hypothetical protein